MSWSHRIENVRQRDWADLVTYWDEFGSGFDTATFLDTSLDEFLEQCLDPLKLNANDILYQEVEHRALISNELVFSQIKANHALVCALSRIDEGHASWGVADAYHASMQLMKSILAALGIFSCRVYDRNVLVDVFPWVGRKDDQKKFKQRHPNWRKLAAIITCTSKEFSQSD